MLAAFSFLVLLIIVTTCRQPNVKFLSFITVFNRKQKLTPVGAKLYVVFSVLFLIGIVLNGMNHIADAARTDDEKAVTQQESAASSLEVKESAVTAATDSVGAPASPNVVSESQFSVEGTVRNEGVASRLITPNVTYTFSADSDAGQYILSHCDNFTKCLVSGDARGTQIVDVLAAAPAKF
jgi:Na+-transporting methylmalonyl-CoA/oxaloacetate decarboxylase gamma subunit